jgi:hypothetical protein
MKRLLLILVIAMPLIAFGQGGNKQKYEIERTDLDNRGVVNHLDVYVAKMTDITEVNKLLVAKYKQPSLKYLQILYYDNKQVAKTYAKKLFDRSVSDGELTRMGKHVIGKFEYLASDNSQSLHIGKDSDMY